MIAEPLVKIGDHLKKTKMWCWLVSNLFRVCHFSVKFENDIFVVALTCIKENVGKAEIEYMPTCL